MLLAWILGFHFWAIMSLNLRMLWNMAVVYCPKMSSTFIKVAQYGYLKTWCFHPIFDTFSTHRDPTGMPLIFCLFSVFSPRLVCSLLMSSDPSAWPLALCSHQEEPDWWAMKVQGENEGITIYGVQYIDFLWLDWARNWYTNGDYLLKYVQCLTPGSRCLYAECARIYHLAPE